MTCPTVNDLAHLVHDDERAQGEVVVMICVRLPSGEYVYAGNRQLHWPDMLTVLSGRGIPATARPIEKGVSIHDSIGDASANESSQPALRQ